ncbi:MAG: YbaK/EbsC family protein [bacterium]|nr:YbaK/EbsC family protein [bacterium]
MSIERVRAYFQTLGIEDRIQEFAVSSATVELAAQAVGVEAARIAKTLSFHDGEGCLLIVAAGDARVDNRRFKDTFHQKARFLTPEEAVAFTGHAVGGVCPFAVGDAVAVYLDESLRRFDTVFPAAGSSNSAIELTCDELFRFSNARCWVDVCKDWREEPEA